MNGQNTKALVKDPTLLVFRFLDDQKRKLTESRQQKYEGSASSAQANPDFIVWSFGSLERDHRSVRWGIVTILADK